MSNYSSLKATINANVKTNGNQEITGSVLNSVLIAMVDSEGAGYQFMGVATPESPGSSQTPDYKCFYLAATPGTYTYLGGLVVADGEVAILKYDSSWSKVTTPIASAAEVSQLGQQVDGLPEEIIDDEEVIASALVEQHEELAQKMGVDEEEVIASALVEQHEELGRVKSKSSDAYPNVNFLDVARIDIDSNVLVVSGNNISPLTTSKNEVGADENGDPDGSVTIKIKSNQIDIEDDIIIAYQGNTSLNDAKKAFSIDTANKHRIGDWVKMDSFHLKAYYTDWLHIRDLVCNKVLEQIYLSRENATRRPYMKYNNFSSGDIRIGSDEGALCHIDGIPAELYINNNYWGLYSLNIKKDRANYYLSKNDNNHIMVDVGTEGMLSSGTILWQYCEFRNPKGLKNMDGTDYDGDHPREIMAGDVKTAWTRFASFLSSLTTSTPKSTIEQYINVQEFVENVIFDEMVFNLDVFRNNTLWTTWDGEHWSPLLYDMDKTFGKGESGYPGVVNGYFPNAAITDVFSLYADAKCPEITTLRAIYAGEIGARYKELRNKGIFSENNFTTLFGKWTTKVGYNIYSDEVSRWPALPTLGLENVQKYIDYIKGRLVYLDAKYGYSTL